MIKKSVVIPIYNECKLLIFTAQKKKKKASERVLREMLIILILDTNA